MGWAAEQPRDRGGIRRGDAPPDRIVRVVLEPREEQAECAIAFGRRPPVKREDGRAGGLRRPGEHLEPDVDRADAVREEHGRGRLGHAGSAAGTPAAFTIRAATRRRSSVAGRDDDVGGREARLLGDEALRIGGGPAYRRDDEDPAAVTPGGLARGLDRGDERARWIGMRAVPEDDVEEDDGRRRIGPGGGDMLVAQSGSIIGWGRPTVYSSSPRSMISWSCARSAPSSSLRMSFASPASDPPLNRPRIRHWPLPRPATASSTAARNASSP